MNQNQDQNTSKLPLPVEIIVHISKYLNIKDKLKLRLINKSFKFVFDNLISIDYLTVVQSDEGAYSNWFYKNESNDELYSNWFYTNKSNNENDLIEFNDINTLNNLFKKDYLIKNLKKLFISLFSKIKLNHTINQLKNLVELNIFYDEIVESNPILSLPKLKILSIQQNYTSEKKIELETPLLSFFRCDHMVNYQFNYPEKLIYLDTKFINYCNEIMDMFKNLEYSISCSFFYKNEFKPNFLTKLNHLKELHFNCLYYQEGGDLNKLKEIYEYKLKLKLDNLKIFLYGIDYDYLKYLNQDQPDKKIGRLELIFDNYSKTIDTLSFINDIDFDKLFEFLNCNPDISLDNIVCKFPNIKSIKATKLNEENIDCFFEFISKYNYLKDLSFTTSISNKIHYLNKLPNLKERIRKLSIRDFNIDQSTNLDFLFKFNGLFDELSLGKIEDVDILEYLLNGAIAWKINCDLVYRENNFYISCTIDEFIYFDIDDEINFNRLDEMLEYFDESIDKEERNESD